MTRLLYTLAICCIITTSLASQGVFFPSRISDPQVEKKYQRAMYALVNLEHRKFYILIEDVISKDPSCFMAKAHRAFHDFHINGSKHPFKKHAKQALASKPTGEVEKIYASILKQRLKNPNTDIRPLLKKLVNKHKNVEAFFMLGNYYLEIGDVKNAHITYYRAYRLNNEFYPLLSLLSSTSLELGYVDAAEVMLEDYLKKFPRKANGYDSMGDLLVVKKDINGAIKNYEKAYSLSKNYKFSKEKADKLKRQLASQ